jgi:hypothetical protein
VTVNVPSRSLLKPVDGLHPRWGESVARPRWPFACQEGEWVSPPLHPSCKLQQITPRAQTTPRLTTSFGARTAAKAAELRPSLGRFQPEHDPEKWTPVFRKDHAATKKPDHDPIQFDRIMV